MKTIEDIKYLMVGKGIITDLANLLRANDEEFAESEKNYLAAVEILRKELPSGSSPTLDDYLAACESDVISAVAYAGYLGFRVNLENFHHSIGIDFVRLDTIDYLTSSNDILDTIGFVNILKGMPHFNTPGATSALLNFIINYYQWEGYRPSSKFLVACFSKIPDFFGMHTQCIVPKPKSAPMEKRNIVPKRQRNIMVSVLHSGRIGYQSF